MPPIWPLLVAHVPGFRAVVRLVRDHVPSVGPDGPLPLYIVLSLRRTFDPSINCSLHAAHDGHAGLWLVAFLFALRAARRKSAMR